MNKIFLVVLFFVGTSSAYARCESYDYNCYYQNQYNSSNDTRSQYKGSSGARYQYDLSNPIDKMNYDMDYGAQIRDQINVNPSRSLDRQMNQYGGGIYDDY